ncbi:MULTISPECIES: D-hexose-6-phosphate mutarotase [unclassified Pseudomonas]|uniref:aldose epimerase family protein n=1 Tax=unclassified Pseudomonas TaxID=196821 RepID=UPI000D3AFF29|nr:MULTISPECIES: D-hexose-6-phosphate mutarotase [unclassified Pseudomonas]RAU46942.1 D-hexose-6-phosphate mutarotase [Pseudomonas sp. RIT 409]RAU54558.1 D-hexose-6-phosphate mutarotase [Pseudomonas sp. RIT 412]
MSSTDPTVPQHPFQRFFTSARPQPTFQWERHQQRDVLIITHPQCQAVFSRQGAQLLHFQPAGQKPWLWCASRWPHVGAIRGGVPVCWPWVGRHPEEGGWPANGWGRLLNWKLIDSREHDEGVSLHWRLCLWDWQADLYAQLGAVMGLRLETQHQDSEPCQFGHALHAYWRVSDVADVALEGLDGAQGYDGINRAVCAQSGGLRLSGGCQRRFDHAGALELQDDNWQRRLSIDTHDSVNTAVWHPGSRPLLGVTGHEAAEFVRVEAASGVGDCLHLAPGQRARLSLQASLVG